jgi:hypothetical protein
MKRLLLDPRLVAASCCWAVGCSSSDPASEADYDDVAQALSSVVASGSTGGDVGAMSDSANVALGVSDGMIRVSATGQFSGTHGGLKYELTAKCNDVAGQALASCTKATDDSTIDLTWSGELALPKVTASVQREGTWTLTGLQSGTATISGDGEFTLDAQLQSFFRNASRTYHVGYSAEYKDVHFDLTTRSAMAGDVSYVIDAERSASGLRGESDAKFHMEGALSFHVDGSATLTLDNTFKYGIDAASGFLVKMK